MTQQITAPVLLIHAEHDTSATVEEVQQFAESLRRLGRECEAHVFHDDTHGLPRHTPDPCQLVCEFLLSHLAPRQ